MHGLDGDGAGPGVEVEDAKEEGEGDTAGVGVADEEEAEAEVGGIRRAAVEAAVAVVDLGGLLVQWGAVRPLTALASPGPTASLAVEVMPRPNLARCASSVSAHRYIRYSAVLLSDGQHFPTHDTAGMATPGPRSQSIASTH